MKVAAGNETLAANDAGPNTKKIGCLIAKLPLGSIFWGTDPHFSDFK